LFDKYVYAKKSAYERLDYFGPSKRVKINSFEDVEYMAAFDEIVPSKQDDELVDIKQSSDSLDKFDYKKLGEEG
jgi:hypothetical protein